MQAYRDRDHQPPDASPRRTRPNEPVLAERLLAMQRTAGNQAVGRMLQRAVIPVYSRYAEGEEKQKDRDEVDRFAVNAGTGPNAGAVMANDLSAGGSVAAIQPPEKIILTGHGNVQTMQGYSGSELADMLTAKWGLRPTFAGELRIDACRAGDQGSLFGFFASSLVEDVSGALQGHQVTVTGLKGNVITPHGRASAPGVPRSLASDEALSVYNQLDRRWRKLEEARRAEFDRGPGGLAQLAATSAQVQLGALEIELRRLEREGGSMVTSMLSWVGMAQTEIEKIKADMNRHRLQAGRQQGIADRERDAIDKLYLPHIQKALAEMDRMGVPFGTASVTVSHGPAERAPKPQQQSSVSGWLSVISASLGLSTQNATV